VKGQCQGSANLCQNMKPKQTCTLVNSHVSHGSWAATITFNHVPPWVWATRRNRCQRSLTCNLP